MNRIARRLKFRVRLIGAVWSGIAGGLGAYFAISDFHPFIAAMFLAVSLGFFWLLIISFGKKDFCIIHPYFSQRLSTELPHTAFGGKEIAAQLDALDTYLHENGLQSISDFGYQQTQQEKMYAPEDLLKSLNFLVQENSPFDSALKNELSQWIDKISIARDEGASVAIHMRISDGVSGLEIDRLNGTY